MTNYLAIPSYLKSMHNVFSNRRRDKLDYILEPLQSLLQLSLLGFSPVGSKLTIQDNILYIQTPGVSQGIIRFFNDDSKEDLYYLFHVFRRFVVYYKHIYTNSKYKQLYELLIELCKRGLDKLIMTYTNIERINILHTLQMYKVMLANPNFIIPEHTKSENTRLEHTKSENTRPEHIKSENTMLEHVNLESARLESEYVRPEKATSKINIGMSMPDFDVLGIGNTENIDNIFKNIVKIYSDEELNIIYNTLLILQHRPEEDCQTYIDGLNLILLPTYSKIKQWITENIAF